MNLHLALLAAAGTATLISASSIAPAQTDAYSSKAANKLAKALAGRTPGQPVSCIGNMRGSDMQIVDDQTILYRQGGTVYVQKPSGGCHGLGSGNYTLLTRLHGSTRLCRGQIGEVVDRVSGFTYGSCVFGDFVPYRKTG